LFVGFDDVFDNHAEVAANKLSQRVPSEFGLACRLIFRQNLEE